MTLQRYTGNFASCLNQINATEQKIATAKQGMQDRILKGKNSDYFQMGCWHPEAFPVINERILAIKGEYNPLIAIEYAKQATEAHRANKEFYLTEKVLLNGKPAVQVLNEIAEADYKKPISKKRVFDMGKVGTHQVSTTDFADDKGIVFLAQGEKLAKNYGKFLKDKVGISEVTFYLPNLTKEDYLRGFWLCGLGSDDGSDFGGCGGGLDYDGGSLFGVFNDAESTQKILPYTKKDVGLAVQNLSRLSKILQPNQIADLEALIRKLKNQ
ncbi:MAG: hypothetical protein PHD81_03545 [Candidatus Nanoarchaeia archaeon]|nr:hypothetical protein [Candidatus Nanoarchaeia archaeon]MDD5588158.1 hypothetical protein [Candidatus Nanoarchaeia archaeon]